MTSVRKRTWTSPSGEEKTAWLVDYRDPAGKRRSKQFVRKKDADAWQVNASFQVSQGTHTADSQSITVERAAQLWLDRCREPNAEGKYLEDTTLAAYEQHVRLHINPLCGGMKLTKISRPMAEDYRSALLKTLSAPMAKRVLRSLRSIFANAMRRGHIGQNVFDGVEAIRTVTRKEELIIPTKAELSAVVNTAAESDNPMVEPLVMSMIFTGLRASELRGLLWSAVDLEKKLLSVTRRADARGNIGPPKTKAGKRVIPLPLQTVKTLKRWKLRCPPSELGLVFPSLNGKVMSHNYMLKNLIRPVLETAKTNKAYGLHAFRHATASLWIEQQVQPKRISVWMGHSSINVTYDIYGHLFDQVDADHGAANAIERGLLA
ncbi:tyrosine-type recombinase/integrase [Parasphingorhabdus sp.]|uniref:tyrosine-type recombinase/integrase n=1 Tax=Parasphingorhabdus sp. TaxID=2709688 RepID=UPI003BB1CC60